MCVIIYREPNVEIDFNKIKSACNRNNDGFGIMIPDRGKLEVIRECDPKGNDPDRVAKLMDDYKGETLALHLRFRTRGDVSLANCHPFPLLNLANHGVDLQLMHNGGIGGYGNNNQSDTFEFAFKTAAPLMEMYRKANGFEGEWTTDPFLIRLLTTLSDNSILFFMDGNGKTLITNSTSNGAKQHDGWWSSNVYSFDGARGVASSTSRPTVSYLGTKQTGASTSLPATVSPTVVTTKSSFQTDKEVEEEYQKCTEYLKVLGKKPVNDKLFGSDSFWDYVAEERDTFLGLTDLPSVVDLCALDDTELFDIVTQYPRMSVFLIKELLYNVWVNENPAKTENKVA